MRAEIEMIRIAARRIVAAMADNQVVRQIAPKANGHGEAVRQDRIAFLAVVVANRDVAIAGGIFTAIIDEAFTVRLEFGEEVGNRPRTLGVPEF